MERQDRLSVAMLSDLFEPDVNGVVTVMDKLSDALSKKCDFVACVPKDKKCKPRRYPMLACRKIRIPIYRDTACLPGLDPKFRKKFRAIRADVLHCHTVGGLYQIALKEGRRRRIPVIVIVHTQSHYDIQKRLKVKKLVKTIMAGLVKSYNRADEIWTLNEGMRQYCLDWGCDPEKLRVVGNASDYLYPADAEERIKRFNEVHDLAPERNVLLFVGRLMEYKNIFFILDSLKILRQRGKSFMMYFVGSGSDRERLESKIRDDGLSDCVQLCGTIRDREVLAGYYLRSKLLLLPSLYDAYSIVQIEAAAHKTPTVFLKGAVTASGFEDGRNMFASEHTPEAYAGRIIEAMEDDGLYQIVSEGAYREMYRTWDSYADFVLDCYRDAIQKYRKKIEN